MNGHQPAVNIPAAVVVFGLAMIVLHILRLAMPEEEGLTMLLALAFIPARYTEVSPVLPGGAWSAITSPITNMIVHGDWTHLTVNLFWMLAFGSAVARRVGSGKFLVFSALCGVVGALTHLALHFGEMIPVVGASAAISGQMAAAVRFIFGARGASFGPPQQLQAVPLAGISETLMNGRFLLFLGIWVVLNLLFGLGGLQLDTGGASIAWEAHIGGFLCGMLTFGLFDRHAGGPRVSSAGL